tara:strand:- start:13743 stop:14669 length:927 start_codon:yes stop_codon:yes gene_type:complete
MSAVQYTFPSKGLGVDNEIPGTIMIIARDVKFGLTSTVKKPTTISGASNVGAEKATTDVDTTKTKAYIQLPMPQNLLFGQSAGYNQDSVGATTSAFASAANSSSFEDMIANNGKDVLSGIITDASNIIRNPLQLAKGIVANPFSFTMFGQMAHRTFNYSWVFVPRNEIESQEIKAICDALSYFQLPGRKTQGFMKFLEIPLHFDIKYLWGGKVNRYLEQPNRSVLQNITVNYGGATRAQRHIDGSPIELSLDLTFVEVEPLIRNEFGNGHQITGADKLDQKDVSSAKDKLSIAKLKTNTASKLGGMNT